MHSDYSVVLLGGIKVNELWPELGNPGRNKTLFHEIKWWVVSEAQVRMKEFGGK